MGVRVGVLVVVAVEVRVGAGSYAVGESSAMMNSLEGRRGMPRPKLVRSAEKGVWAKPTNMNNVETYANVPFILEIGGAAYAQVGTSKSTGTKLFAPSGQIRRGGRIAREQPFVDWEKRVYSLRHTSTSASMMSVVGLSTRRAATGIAIAPMPPGLPRRSTMIFVLPASMSALSAAVNWSAP